LINVLSAIDLNVLISPMKSRFWFPDVTFWPNRIGKR